MKEKEWLSGTEPKPMLEFLRWQRSAARTQTGRRQLRLFGCACCRRVWRLLQPEGQKAVEVAERFADGEEVDLLLAHNLAWKSNLGIAEAPSKVAEAMPWQAAGVWLRTSAKHYAKVRGTTTEQERSCQVAYLRCIFGNPFRPVSLDPSWRTADVLPLARAVYEERSLPAGTFDGGRLAVLADALEEAGCTEPVLLAHLRGPGPHVRGCWVVDALLAKQ